MAPRAVGSILQGQGRERHASTSSVWKAGYTIAKPFWHKIEQMDVCVCVWMLRGTCVCVTAATKRNNITPRPRELDRLGSSCFCVQMNGFKPPPPLTLIPPCVALVPRKAIIFRQRSSCERTNERTLHTHNNSSPGPQNHFEHRPWGHVVAGGTAW